MAQDGLYTKLHLTVRARTQPGQVVLVSGSATSDRTSGALEMVTSPDAYPIWRTPKPVIIARGVRHDYRYSIRSAHDVEAEPGDVRSVKTNKPEQEMEDTFGVTPPKPPSSFHELANETSQSTRLVIVCYHLPVRVVRNESNAWTASWGSSIIAKSPSESIADSRETWWVGTIHGGLNRRQLTAADRDEIRRVLEPMHCIPVFSSNSEEGYLNYCKRILWPSFHNVTVLDQCCAAWHEETAWDQDAGSSWEAYESMNSDFRDMLLDFLRAGDTVWVHDYHLMLLPSLLSMSEPFRVDRHQSRKARIVFFLHAPFPTSQVFCALANGPKLLEGVVGADVVGFHAFEHARHFLNACTRLMGMERASVAGGITGVLHQGRTVMVVVRHVSVETDQLEKALKQDVPEQLGTIEALIIEPSRETPNKAKRLVLCSVDPCQRLSGIALKLLAYERFLAEYPRWRGRVALIQYCLLDGTRVDDEARTAGELRTLAQRLNAQNSGSVVLIERPSGRLGTAERLALFQRADVLVGTAIREGHTLYPSEYCLARALGKRGPGVILASEFSATSTLMSGAVSVNPFDVPSVADALDTALSMDAVEKRDRLDRDLPYVKSRPSGRWTQEILEDMETVHRQVTISDEDAALAIAQRMEIGRLADAFSRSSRRFLFLDLGGTLIPKGDSVSKVLKSATKSALLRPGVRRALQALSEDDQTTVYVVSGTTPSALESLFSDLPHLCLAAANGLATAIPVDGKRSSVMTSYGTDWQAVRRAALPLMKRRAAWTNGSAVLKREPGLAWSYYRADPEWGRIQALQLAQDLKVILAPFNVEVAHREGMLEVVPAAQHKGHVVKKALTEALGRGEPPDFVLCVGDALSDEKMFSSVYSYLADAPRAPLDRAFTVAVGRKASRALFYLDDDAHVGDTLAALAGRAA